MTEYKYLILYVVVAQGKEMERKRKNEKTDAVDNEDQSVSFEQQRKTIE
jgi:hypothetical protein